LTIENVVAGGGDSAAAHPEPFRYGVVFLLTLALVVFVIAAPSANWSRAVALAIEGLALVVAIATGRQRREVRYYRTAGVGVAILLVVAGVWSGIISVKLSSVATALVTAAVPVVIVRGLLRLLRERGVTLQAVAGALAIYLSVGLVFAAIISFIAQVDSTLYFAQHTSGTEGERVYFSFTVLTTTGFGDFAAATPVGHALAVIEMLTGQFYLVTVPRLVVDSPRSIRRCLPCYRIHEQAEVSSDLPSTAQASPLVGIQQREVRRRANVPSCFRPATSMCAWTGTALLRAEEVA
jgi:hypothetical protein